MFEPILSLTQSGWSIFAIIALALTALVLSSYVKIVTVLSILRIGLGVSSLASVFVTSGLALALSFFVMFPTLRESTAAMDAVVSEKGAAAHLSENDRTRALEAGVEKWRLFIARHADENERSRFAEIARDLDKSQSESKADTVQPEQKSSADTLEQSWRVLAPAFLVSELKSAFATGLSLFLPFLVIDLVVAAAMLAVGFTALDPRIIAFPLKLLLFVAVDGWLLITSNLVMAYAQ